MQPRPMLDTNGPPVPRGRVLERRVFIRGSYTRAVDSGCARQSARSWPRGVRPPRVGGVVCQLSRADAETPLAPAVLERLAMAAYLVGRDVERGTAGARAPELSRQRRPGQRSTLRRVDHLRPVQPRRSGARGRLDAAGASADRRPPDRLGGTGLPDRAIGAEGGRRRRRRGRAGALRRGGRHRGTGRRPRSREPGATGTGARPDPVGPDDGGRGAARRGDGRGPAG